MYLRPLSLLWGPCPFSGLLTYLPATMHSKRTLSVLRQEPSDVSVPRGRCLGNVWWMRARHTVGTHSMSEE